MSLLIPLGLLGLVGLLIPVLIHLQRQIQRSPVSFAALRWLAAAARPRQRLRLQQWPLLLLRMALIGVASLLLAQPIWTGAEPAARWVLIHPQLAAPAEGVAEADTEFRWLAAGFPPLDQGAPPGPWPVSSLLREIDAELPLAAEIEVRLPPEVGGMDGQRLALRRPLTIVEVPSSVTALGGDTDARISWSVRTGSADHPALPYVSAALAALSAEAHQGASQAETVIIVDEDLVPQPPLSASRALIWLHDDSPLEHASVADWIRQGGVALWLSSAALNAPARSVPIWRSLDGMRVVSSIRHGGGWLLQPESELTAQTYPEVLEPSFPALLQSWLAPEPTRPNRTLSGSLSPSLIEAAAIVRGVALEHTLVWLLLVLLVAERVMAMIALRSKR